MLALKNCKKKITGKNFLLVLVHYDSQFNKFNFDIGF